MSGDIVERLLDHATDWNGEQMPDIEPAKGDPTAGTLRAAAGEIIYLQAKVDTLREALRSIAEGNLGEEPWQADYEKLRLYARAAVGETQ